MRDPDGSEHGATGEYTVVDPPHRLVFTWVWDHAPVRRQLIELLFSERDRRTSVVMTNSAIATDDQLVDEERGWHLCYDNLDHSLATT